MWNYSDKKITINDSNDNQIGYIRRIYKNPWQKLLRYIPIILSLLETVHIDAKDNEHEIKIREQSFKSNLTRLKWDVFSKTPDKEKVLFLEDRTKISTNPRMVYTKENKHYLFKVDLFNRTCEVTCASEKIAFIKIEKRIPFTISAELLTNDLKIIEVLSIYFAITLIY